MLAGMLSRHLLDNAHVRTVTFAVGGIYSRDSFRIATDPHPLQQLAFSRIARLQHELPVVECSGWCHVEQALKRVAITRQRCPDAFDEYAYFRMLMQRDHDRRAAFSAIDR